MDDNYIYQVRVVIDGEEYIKTNYEGEWRFETLEEAEVFFEYVRKNEYEEDIRIVRTYWNADKTIDEDYDEVVAQTYDDIVITFFINRYRQVKK